MQIVAITGASGFIGQHLVGLLAQNPNIKVRILVHRRSDIEVFNFPNVDRIEGDLMLPSSLDNLLESGSTLVNLAYLSSHTCQDNLVAMENLADACVKAQIQRFVHCSTATVVGSVPDDEINEETRCAPESDYEVVKFAIENLLLEKAHNCFDLTILRPTAVFGPGGKNLLKLADDIRLGNRAINYLKSCLYGRRKMNLVSIENVVSALVYLVTKTQPFNKEVFFISDDENINNNYRDVEKYLVAKIRHKDYLLPRIPLPQTFLSACLKLAGRTNSNPQRVYRSSKIRDTGFQEPVTFEEGLELFSNWYQKQFQLSKKND